MATTVMDLVLAGNPRIPNCTLHELSMLFCAVLLLEPNVRDIMELRGRSCKVGDLLPPPRRLLFVQTAASVLHHIEENKVSVGCTSL